MWCILTNNCLKMCDGQLWSVYLFTAIYDLARMTTIRTLTSLDSVFLNMNNIEKISVPN